MLTGWFDDVSVSCPDRISTALQEPVLSSPRSLPTNIAGNFQTAPPSRGICPSRGHCSCWSDLLHMVLLRAGAVSINCLMARNKFWVDHPWRRIHPPRRPRGRNYRRPATHSHGQDLWKSTSNDGKQFESRHTRHLQVGDDYVRDRLLQLGKGREAIFGDYYVIASDNEQHRNGLPNVRIVIHHEDLTP